jgi:hypothetical protein
MGKTRSFALTLGLSTALCVNAGLAFADAEDDEATDEKGPASTSAEERRSRRSSRADESPEERLAKRKERLEQGAKRLRERAEEMRKKAAAGEQPAISPKAKRPPRSYAEQAERLEEQAKKMEERSKTLTLADTAPRTGERSASSRQRRHQVRRIQLNRRWGDTLKDPEAIAELKLHAERSAQLKRIRTLAMQRSKDDPAAARASQILGREVARHEGRMKELQAKSVAASVNAPAAASAPAPAAPAPADTPAAAPASADTPAAEETSK